MKINLKMVFKTILSGLVFNLVVCANGRTPPGLSAVIGQKQYYIGNYQQVGWYRAAQLCANLGMSLASIDTEMEQKNIYNYLNTNSIVEKGYWLSGINLAASATASIKPYIWLATGQQISYTNWADQQPGTGNCISTITTEPTLKWITDECTTENYYICSKPLLPACGDKGQCYYTYSYYIN